MILSIVLGTLLFINFYYPQNIENSTPISKIDEILVKKNDRTMTLYQDHQAIRTYRIALGFNPIGHKEKEGDGRTPEGQYVISAKNPTSQFHLSLKISYPSMRDRLKALVKGVNPGGDIMIHGLMPSIGWVSKLHTMKDWTRGCIAVTNQEIEEIYGAVEVGTRVTIQP